MGASQAKQEIFLKLVDEREKCCPTERSTYWRCVDDYYGNTFLKGQCADARGEIFHLSHAFTHLCALVRCASALEKDLGYFCSLAGMTLIHTPLPLMQAKEWCSRASRNLTRSCNATRIT